MNPRGLATPHRNALFVLLVFCAAIGVVALWGVTSFNRMVALDEGVRAQWAQVENVYQRRLDLVPNLVRTVQGAANFERGTLLAVTEARTRATEVTPTAGNADVTRDPQAFARYQQAQSGLTSALSRLMVVVERYPELRATENFRDLQSQLEGTENRITVERMRFNEAARAFNTRRETFPNSVLLGMMGARFRERSYFESAPEARRAPDVRF
jgi:LemA protein